MFGLGSSVDYAMKVANYLDIPLSEHTEYYFEDREPYVRSNINVRGCDVYVIQSLYSDDKESIGDKLIKLLIFIGSLKDASARNVNLIVPYLGLQRQDRKCESRAPITTKYLAQLIESVGCSRIMTMDVHNLSSFQGSFRISTDNLEAKNLLARYVADHVEDAKNLVILSPDNGGMSRARRFRNTLNDLLKAEIGFACLDKIRAGQEVESQCIVGDVKNKQVIVLDDMISSGGSVRECARLVKAQKGEVWAACATHGLFVGKAEENLEGVRRIIIADTIWAGWRLTDELKKKIHVIPTVEMFGKAIRRTFEDGGSISDLLK
jgi:ribose-phosphate pyrophosphokinase